jgi:hypothetical protein
MATATDSTTWRPDKGEHPQTIVGILRDVRTVSGSYGDYPLLELEGNDGIVWLFHAFRDVAKSELAACAPQIGEKITVAYLGVPEGKSYHVYKVRRAAGHSQQINWSRFSDGAAPIDTANESMQPSAPAPEPDMPAGGEFGDGPPF